MAVMLTPEASVEGSENSFGPLPESTLPASLAGTKAIVSWVSEP
jgi:hypothetical protein